MNFSESSLGELCSLGGGEVKTGPFGSQLHKSDYATTGIPVVMPKDIKGGSISTNGIARVPEKHALRLAQHRLNPGDIVYGRRGDIGRHAFVSPEEEGWLCGTGCLRITLGEGPVLPLYLHYYLDHPEVIGRIYNKAVGATMPNLNTAILSSVIVRFPDRNAQKKIVGALAPYDDLIENNVRRIRILEEIFRTLYKEWTVFESSLVSLTKLSDEIRKSIQPQNIEPGKPYIGLEHIPRRSITLRDWEDSDSVMSTKLEFKTDDVLFGKIRPYFHKVVLAPVDGVCSSDTIILRAKKPQYLSLLLAVTSSVEFVDHATATSQGTKMPRANWKVLL